LYNEVRDVPYIAYLLCGQERVTGFYGVIWIWVQWSCVCWSSIWYCI